MKKKKIIAFITAIVMIVSSCCIGLYVQAKSFNPNVVLLENMLNNRYWIIESLVNDDFSNNPYREVNSYASDESIMDEVLTNYKNDASFKMLVDVLNTKDDIGTYVDNLGQEAIAGILNFLGIIDDAALNSYLDNYVKSASNLKYEDIINAVLKEDYTSSWGASLFEGDAKLEEYRQLSKTLKSLSGYQKALKDNSNLLATGYFTSEKEFMDYTDHFLTAYEDTLYDALVNLPGCEEFSENEALTKKIIGASALAFVLKAETYDPEKLDDDSNYQGYLMSDFYFNYFADDINAVLAVAGKTLEISSVATEYAMLLNTLVSQTDTTVSVMNRVKNHTSNEDLANTLNVYAQMVNDQGNSYAYTYDAIIDYATRQGYVGKALIKTGQKTFTDYGKLVLNKMNGKQIVLASKIADQLVSLGKCVGIAMWVADKATNIQETSKKIYLCKYIQSVINETVKVFRADYNAYLNNKTDENAKKVIDDLEFLKKLRLYGEKQAYGSVCSQTESVVGLLLGSNDVQDYIDNKYQANVDSILGCTIYQTNNNGLTINKDESLIVYIKTLSNGSKTTVARYTKKNGDYVVFPEADMILMSSLKLNGGTVSIANSGTNRCRLFIPNITISADSSISVKGSDIAIGEITNSSASAILEFEFLSDDTTLQITDLISNAGTISFKGNTRTIKCQDISNSKTINLGGSLIDLYGDINNNGTINGKVNVCGTGTKTYNDGYNDIDIQKLDGAGTYTNLEFNNYTKQGAKINGSSFVTEVYDDNSTKLKGATNIYLTGNCAIGDNYLKNGVSFKDYTSNTGFTVNGASKIYNAVTLNGKTNFNDCLMLSDSATSLSLNNETLVKGDLQYKNGEINGSEWLKIKGDLEITAASPKIDCLYFDGVLPQTVNSSKPLTVKKLSNHNISGSGIDVNCKIYITDELLSGSTAKYSNGENIVLTQNAKLEGGKIRGNISAEDWICKNNAEVSGTLKASGAMVVSEGVTLNTNSYCQSGGTLNVESGATINTEVFSQSGVTNNNGLINVSGDSMIASEFNGGTLVCKGDLISKAKLTPNELKISGRTGQVFNNSKETTVANLTIDNESKAGFNVGSVIYVTNTFNNNCKNLINSEKIILIENASYVNEKSVVGDLTISGEYTVDSGTELTVNGNVIINSNTAINIKSGAKLIVKQGFISKSSNVVVENGAILQIDNYLKSSSDLLTINGSLVVKGDSIINSSTVNAEGMITFKGDLSTASCVWNNPNVKFMSGVPQEVNGSKIFVNDLIIDNFSNSGITFNSNINYYGKYENNSSVITNESRIEKISLEE